MNETKKDNKKKILIAAAAAAIVVIVVLLLVLKGCNGTEEANTTSATETLAGIRSHHSAVDCPQC